MDSDLIISDVLMSDKGSFAMLRNATLKKEFRLSWFMDPQLD